MVVWTLGVSTGRLAPPAILRPTPLTNSEAKYYIIEYCCFEYHPFAETRMMRAAWSIGKRLAPLR
jgi:hypothetical protein